MAPPVQLNVPLTDIPDVPANIEPLRLTTPLAPTVETAPLRVSELVAMASVCVPVTAPKVSMSIAALTSRLTVYVPARSIFTVLPAPGTIPNSQLAGSLQLPPEAFVHMKTTAWAVASKVTDGTAEKAGRVAVACMGPGEAPSVQMTCAIPCASVNTDVADSEPLPAATLNTTSTPSTPWPSAAVTVTTIGCDNAAPMPPV